VEGAQAEAMRAPLRDWADAHALDARGAVAAFLSPDGARIEMLPAVRRQGVWVGETWRVAPVWPDPADRMRAAALVASAGQARLMMLENGALRATHADLPDSLETFLGPKEVASAETLHARAPGARADAFGETPEQEREEELTRYAAALARGAAQALQGTGAPLVVVADERLQGAIRAACDYPQLTAQGVTRHPESMSEEDLAEAVRAAAAAQAESARETDRERVEAALGRGDPASRDPAEIAAAAREGRVELLLFDPGAVAPGRLEMPGGPARDPDGPDDLVDAALRGALRSGAETRAQAGGEPPLMAVMRW
jgi:hypothetical protein